jgi:acyl dehydratase
MNEIIDLNSLRARIGEEIMVSDWLEVSQERICMFASATDDHQWIHVDPNRSRLESPSKSTIAHGFLTLSLVTALITQTVSIPSASMVTNCGLNKVRFTSPVPSGSRIRGRFILSDFKNGGTFIQIVWNVIIEYDRGAKPCCTFEWIIWYWLESSDKK